MNYTPEQTQQKRQQDIISLCEQIISKNISFDKIENDIFKIMYSLQNEPQDYKNHFVQIAQITGLSEKTAGKRWDKTLNKKNNCNINTFFYLCKNAGLDINTKTEQNTEKTKASKLGTLWDKNAKLVLWIVFEKPFEHPYYDKLTGQYIKNDRHTFYSKKLTESEPSDKDTINFFFEKIERLNKVSPIKKSMVYLNLNRGGSIANDGNIQLLQYYYNPNKHYKNFLSIKGNAILRAESLPYLHIQKYLSLKEIDEYVFSLQELEQKMLIPKGRAQKTKEYILNHYQQYTANSQKFHAERAEKQHANNNVSIPANATELHTPQTTENAEDYTKQPKTEHVQKKTAGQILREAPRIYTPIVPLSVEQKIQNYITQINALSDNDFFEMYQHHNRQEQIKTFSNNLINEFF